MGGMRRSVRIETSSDLRSMFSTTTMASSTTMPVRDQAEQSQRIDRETGEQQSGEGADDGHGNRDDQRDHARAPGLQKHHHHQHHQHTASNKVVDHRFDRLRTKHRWVVVDFVARLPEKSWPVPSCSPAHDRELQGIRPGSWNTGIATAGPPSSMLRRANCRGPVRAAPIAKVGGLAVWRHSWMTMPRTLARSAGGPCIDDILEFNAGSDG